MLRLGNGFSSDLKMTSRINIQKFEEAYKNNQLKYFECQSVSSLYDYDIYRFKVKCGDNAVYGLKISSRGYAGWFYSWGNISGYHFDISFEKLFEAMPVEVKEELLFNLDIFNGKI